MSAIPARVIVFGIYSFSGSVRVVVSTGRRVIATLCFVELQTSTAHVCCLCFSWSQVQITEAAQAAAAEFQARADRAQVMTLLCVTVMLMECLLCGVQAQKLAGFDAKEG